MPNLAMINRPSSRLRHSATHHLSEIALILRVERDDARLCSSNDDFAGLENPLTCFLLKSFDDEQQQKTALEELDAEEIWHEADVRVIMQESLKRVRGFEGVRDCGRKSWRGGPEVFVFEEGDGVPFPH